MCYDALDPVLESGLNDWTAYVMCKKFVILNSNTYILPGLKYITFTQASKKQKLGTELYQFPEVCI